MSDIAADDWISSRYGGIIPSSFGNCTPAWTELLIDQLHLEAKGSDV